MHCRKYSYGIAASQLRSACSSPVRTHRHCGFAQVEAVQNSVAAAATDATATAVLLEEIKQEVEVMKQDPEVREKRSACVIAVHENGETYVVTCAFP